jgi:glutathione S-transferase
MNPTHVFHTPHSRSTRVVWALEEIGAPYAVTQLTREERRGPEHRARHALGRVPLIEDEGRYLFESGAIVLALADRHPDAGLNFAPGTRERELVYQWVLFVMAELEPPIVEVRDTREADPARAAAATERFGEAAALVERALDGRAFLVGDRFSAADIMVGEVLGFARAVGLLERFPALEAYMTALYARPAFAVASAP